MGASIPPRKLFQSPLAWSEISQVPDAREDEFYNWMLQNGVSPEDLDKSAYDYRGAFLAGINRDPAGGHFPDTFKQHGHDSFSRESKYSQGPTDGGHWEGETYVPGHIKGEVLRHALEMALSKGKK